MCCRRIKREQDSAWSRAGPERKEAVGSTLWEGGKETKQDRGSFLRDAHWSLVTIKELAPSTSTQPCKGRKHPFYIFSLRFLFLGQQGGKETVSPAINPSPVSKVARTCRSPAGVGRTTPPATPPVPSLSDQRCALPPGDPGPPPHSGPQPVKSPF